MKKLNYLNLAMMVLCTGFSFTSCGEEEEPTSTIDPVISPQEWVTDEYTGTTFTDLDSRGMVMHIDTTYNQPLIISKNEQGLLMLTYPNWTDHQGMSYGDFQILPLEAIATTDGVILQGICTDSLYKAGTGYPATLRATGVIKGEDTHKQADLTLNIDLVVSPKMTLKFTLKYEGFNL